MDWLLLTVAALVDRCPGKGVLFTVGFAMMLVVFRKFHNKNLIKSNSHWLQFKHSQLAHKLSCPFAPEGWWHRMIRMWSICQKRRLRLLRLHLPWCRPCGLWLMDFVTPLSLLVDAAYIKTRNFHNISHSSYNSHIVLREIFHGCTASICVLFQDFESHSLGLWPHFFEAVGPGCPGLSWHFQIPEKSLVGRSHVIW